MAKSLAFVSHVRCPVAVCALTARREVSRGDVESSCAAKAGRGKDALQGLMNGTEQKKDSKTNPQGSKKMSAVSETRGGQRERETVSETYRAREQS